MDFYSLALRGGARPLNHVALNLNHRELPVFGFREAATFVRAMSGDHLMWGNVELLAPPDLDNLAPRSKELCSVTF